MAGFAQAVPFTRIAHERGRHAHVVQGDVKLLGLGDRHVVVVLAVQDERRRLRLVNLADRRALPQLIHEPVLVRIAPVLHGQVVVVVGHVVEAHQVADAGAWDGRLEPGGLGDDPVGELPAVAAALDAELRLVDPRIPRDRRVHAGHDVLGLRAVLVAEDLVGEGLAVAGRAAVVHHQRRPALRGVDLRLGVEGRPLLAVRPAVDHHDQGMRGRGRLVQRPREERLDLGAVHARKRDRLDRRDLPLPEQGGVERRAPHGRGRTRLRVEIGRRVRRGEGVGHRVARGRERRHAAARAHHGLGRPTGCRQPHQRDMAVVLYRDVDVPAIARPLRRALPVVDDLADLRAAGAVGVHHPHVRVFHRRLRRGQVARRAAEGDARAIGRPRRRVLCALGGREPSRLAGAGRHGEHVVVEGRVGVGLAIRHEQDVVALRRPVDRVLVRRAGRELRDLTRADVGHEEVGAAIVVEAREALAGAGLVEIPRDHHRVAVGVGALGPGRGRHERDAPAVGRPRHLAPGRWQRMVRVFDRRHEPRAAAVGFAHHDAGALGAGAQVGEAPSIRRPERARRPARQRSGHAGVEVQHRDDRVRAALLPVVYHRVGHVRAGGRDLDLSHGREGKQVVGRETGPHLAVKGQGAQGQAQAQAQRYDGGGRSHSGQYMRRRAPEARAAAISVQRPGQTTIADDARRRY